MTNRVLFLDVDGVFIPARVYMMAGQTKPIVTTFCPSVVGMVNDICEQTGAKLVIHSSWLRTNLQFLNCDLFDHTGETNTHNWMIHQGLKAEYFHEDHSCQYRFSGTRWMAITDWLLDHPDITDYWILDDEPIYGEYVHLNRNRIIQTDFGEGFSYDAYTTILKEWCSSRTNHDLTP